MDCTNCKKIKDKDCFSYCDRLKRHYFNCDDCRNKIKEYKKNSHYQNIKKDWDCYRCKKIFNTEQNLQYHISNTKSCKKYWQENNKYYKYDIFQLRKICLANNIKNASRMKKDDIINELIKLENVIIPEYLN